MTKPYHAPRRPPAWLRALGHRDLPPTIRHGDRTYRHVKTFKHDFFAATGLYNGPDGKAVLKVMRQAPLFGLPLSWLGALVMRHEVRLYRLADGVDGVPHLIGPWGPTGFLHAYAEGRPLARQDVPDDRFFPTLSGMLAAIHRRGAAYVDLEKRENILLGADGKPHLIDFQISWHIPPRRGGNTWIARGILGILQNADRYHLLKHWRRLRPDQLDPAQIADSHRAPFWIRWHRAIFRPLTHLRRRVLVRLGARNSTTGRSPG